MTEKFDRFLGYSADKWGAALSWAEENRPDLVFASNGREALHGAWESVYTPGDDRCIYANTLRREYELALIEDHKVWICR